MGLNKENQNSQNEISKELLMRNLNDMEAYIRAFWSFLPIPVCYVNPAFNIIEISDSFEKLFGFNEFEIIGKNIEKLFSDQQEFKKIQEIIENKKPIFDKETDLVSKQGKEILVSLSAMFREDEKGDIVGYFFAFLDITERKKNEQVLKQKIKELEKFAELTVNRELEIVILKENLRNAQEEIKKLKINCEKK